MRANIVKQPAFLAIATFAAVTLLVFARVLSAPYEVEAAGLDMPLGRLIEGFVGRQPVVSYTIALLLVCACGVLITRLINRYNINSARTGLPIVMYLLMGYGLLAPLVTVGAGLVSLLLIVSSMQMIAAFKRAYTFNNVFNSAFCLGLMPLLYSASLPLVLILPVTLSLYRRTAREWIVALVGLCTPLLIVSAGWVAAGYEWEFVAGELGAALAVPSGTEIIDTVKEIGIAAYIYAGLTAGLLLFSIAAVMGGLHKTVTRPRKIYVHFICLTLLSAATFFIPSGNVLSLELFAVPAALFATVFFIWVRGAAGLALYLTLIGLVVAMNTMPLL